MIHEPHEETEGQMKVFTIEVKLREIIFLVNVKFFICPPLSKVFTIKVKLRESIFSVNVKNSSDPTLGSTANWQRTSD